VTVLLDEGVPRIVQRRLPHLPIFTVDQMGWRGIKNGQLLDHMDGTFTILVTTDKNLRFQQTFSSGRSPSSSFQRTEFHSSSY
jgi:hypothetical protein